MGSILFLISIFSAFEIDHNNSYLNSIIQNQESGVEVEFTAVPHLSVGDPVLFKGEQVGSVAKVEIANSESADKKDKQYHLGKSRISIKLNDVRVPVDEHFVALVAKVKMPVEGVRKPAVRSVLELIQLNGTGKKQASQAHSPVLHGFTSFEEFWNSSSKTLPNA